MLLSHDATRCRSVFTGVNPTRYSALMTQDDDWSARMARLIAREVRRYREGQGQRPRMSAQQLADRTEELGMPIPRSVLANLESGRRETVSVAEVLVLAAALNVAPVELICPVGFDKETEMLPGRAMDQLAARRWFTGMWKLDIDDAGAWTMRTPATSEQSNAYLLEYHDGLIAQMRAKEADAARAAADAASADEVSLRAAIRVDEAEQAAAAAKAAGDATAPALEGKLYEARAAADAAGNDHIGKAAWARDRMQLLAEWREFIREPLRQTREEMRRRGMLLPDLPADIDLGGDDG
jgi:transcriptional regulator with XRE-family HTH domain